MTTIVLADDHHVMRQGLHSLLSEQPDFEVIGEAGGGQEALRLVESLHPSVLVLDMAMPDMNGAEVTRQVARTSPSTAVVILSMYGSEGYVRKAMQAGAKAYILKESTADELVTAIREVAGGRRYLSRALDERAIESYIKESMTPPFHGQMVLTRREREILPMLAKGHTAGQIAAELHISPRTAESHRSNLMRKLGVHNYREFIRYCAEAGLLPP